MADSNDNRYSFPEEEDQTTNFKPPSGGESSLTPYTDDTPSADLVNNNSNKTNKELVKAHYNDLLHEMLSAALVSVGEVLQTKYSSERTDGKPRKT